MSWTLSAATAKDWSSLSLTWPCGFTRSCVWGFDVCAWGFEVCACAGMMLPNVMALARSAGTAKVLLRIFMRKLPFSVDESAYAPLRRSEEHTSELQSLL